MEYGTAKATAGRTLYRLTINANPIRQTPSWLVNFDAQNLTGTYAIGLNPMQPLVQEPITNSNPSTETFSVTLTAADIQNLPPDSGYVAGQYAFSITNSAPPANLGGMVNTPSVQKEDVDDVDEETWTAQGQGSEETVSA